MSNRTRRVVAIDTESVGVGPGFRGEVAQVSMVEMHTNRTFNAYISRYNISDYRTKFSGITPQILASKGRPFHIVKKEAMNFMRGAILVGHSIHHDLSGLGIEVMQGDVRDISKYWYFKQANNGRTPSLAFLAERFLRKKIRQNGQHSCMEDARTTLQLYGLVAKRWEADLKSRRHRTYVEEFQPAWHHSEELYDDFFDNCFNTYYDDVFYPWENDDYDDYDYDYLYFY